jgi:phage terminase large subunit
MSRQIINDRYDISFLPSQQRVFDCIVEQETPNIFYCAGFGGAKTRLIGEAGWELGLAYSGIELLYFRKTRTSIVDTTYKDFIDDVVPPEYIKKHDKSKLELWTLNDSYFHFFGIDNFSRKGSLKADGIFVDESTELTEDDIIMLEGRLRGKVLKCPFICYVGNAGAPNTPLWNRFVKQLKFPKAQQDPDFKYLSGTSYENIHNPPAYFKRLDKWKGTIYYDRYVLSQWKAFEGLVYIIYDPEVHLIDPFEIPRDWIKTVVIDFGYSLNHPLVVNWYADNPIYGITYLYRQYYRVHKLLSDAVRECKRITDEAGENIHEIICDWDAENRAQVDKMWMHTTPANKSVEIGIQSMVSAMLELPCGSRGFHIFNDLWSTREKFKYGLVEKDVLLEEKSLPTCTQEEFGKYIWGRDNKPVKDFDHGMDTCRYKIHTHRVANEGSDLKQLTRPEIMAGGYGRR